MVLNFLVALFLMAPLTAWGFSSERTQAYLQEARSKKLWTEPQWQKLGHYRNSLWTSARSPLQGDFFLAPDGNINPRAELERTIEVLFAESSSAKHPQCRYLARTQWLSKVLQISAQDLLPCTEQAEWKKQLGATELFIIFASSDLNSAGSSFGHTFLRAHNPKNTGEKELLDYGVNYAAITGQDGGALYALKGLFGSYPGAYSMEPYHQKLREYTNLEGRNIWEYKLDLSPEDVDFVINHLLELEGSYAPYYFLSDNCSQQILELIEVATPQADLTSRFRDATIPLDTIKELKAQNLLIGERSRTSLFSQWQTHHKNLSPREKKAVREVINTQTPPDLTSLSPAQQAETLEATLSYLAILEYRNKGSFDELKYRLSVQRARLGAVTSPLNIEKPVSPLLSQDSSVIYAGAGTYDNESYLRLKYRRAFHDLLSEDSGLSPFSHLEVLGVELRHFPELEQTDLYQFTLLKILNTPPVTEFDRASTWLVDVGTGPRLAPYVHWGLGYSKDLPGQRPQRASLMFKNENYHLLETADPQVGFEFLLMSKWHPQFRSVVSVKSLYQTRTSDILNTYGLGVSWGTLGQYRFETQFGETQQLQLSVMF